jgi:hypothetical protein
MSEILREVDKVSFVPHVKAKRENSDEEGIDLILLQKSGQMIFPGFQTNKIPTNISVKTEQQFQSYCRYFLSNFVLRDASIQELRWEQMGRELFVYFDVHVTKVKPNYFFVTPAEILNQKHYLGTCISETVSNFLSTNLKKVTSTELFPQVFYLHVEEADAIYFRKLPLERNQEGYFSFRSEIDENKTNLRYAVFVGRYGLEEAMGENDDTCFKESNVLVKSRKQFSLLF